MNTLFSKYLLVILIIFLFNFFDFSQINKENSNTQRLALVIGNNDYIFGTKLKNAVNDADLVSKVLKSLNFEVILGKDFNKLDFENQIKNFNKIKSNYQIVLFYYAGHGIQVEGKNYLIPTDAKLEVKSDVKFETISVDFIADILEENKSTNIIILDACRNNPFKTFERSYILDLSQPTKLSSGSLISYGTKENSTASDGLDSNGLFTKCLSSELEKKQSLSDVFINTRAEVLKQSNFTQCPQEWNMLTEQIYLNTSKTQSLVTNRLKSGEYTLYRYGDTENSFPVTKFQIDSMIQCNDDFFTFKINGIGQNWNGNGVIYSNIGFYKWNFKNGESGVTRFKFNKDNIIDGEVTFDSNPLKNWKFTAIPNF